MTKKNNNNNYNNKNHDKLYTWNLFLIPISLHIESTHTNTQRKNTYTRYLSIVHIKPKKK